MKKILLRIAAALAVAAIAAPAAYAYYTTTVSATITLNASFSETISTGFPDPLSGSQAITQTDSYVTSGTGSGQIDTVYAAQFSLAASTPQTINLTSLTDPLGKSISFARVRDFVVQNTASTSGYDCQVYASASNGWAVLPASSGPLYARAGSVVRLSDKLSTGSGAGNIVSGSSNSVTFNPGSNAVTINVWIVGGSAQ